MKSKEAPKMKSDEFKMLTVQEKSCAYRHMEGVENKRSVLIAILVDLARIGQESGMDDLPLNELAKALYDLSIGVVPALFEKAHTSGRPKASIRKSGLMGYVAACMELHVLAGETKEKAARLVFTELKRLGLSNEVVQDSRLGTEGFVTVIRWRDRCMAGSPADDTEVQVYRRVVQEARSTYYDPKVGAEVILASITKYYPPNQENR